MKLTASDRKNVLVLRGMVRHYQENKAYFDALFRDLEEVEKRTPPTRSENLDRGMIEALKRLHGAL